MVSKKIIKRINLFMRFFAFATLLFSSLVQPQEAVIEEGCEIIEGWVTVWIDQIRQAREAISGLEVNDVEFEEELKQKMVYVQSEYDRYSSAFKLQCDNEGSQPQK